MTFGTLIAHVTRNLGGRSEASFPSLVKEWINSSYLDIVTTGKFPEAGKYAPIPVRELDSTAPFETGIGGTSYPLPINFLFPISCRDTDNNHPLRWRGIRWYDRYKSSSNGKPSRYIIYGGKIYIDPPSDGVYTIQLRYRKKVSVPALVQDADIPVVDEIWHEGVELCATYRGKRSLQHTDATVWLRDLKSFVAAHSEQFTEEESDASFGFRIAM